MTAAQALEHPWLGPDGPASAPLHDAINRKLQTLADKDEFRARLKTGALHRPAACCRLPRLGGQARHRHTHTRACVRRLQTLRPPTSSGWSTRALLAVARLLLLFDRRALAHGSSRGLQRFRGLS
jgi:hypothetical protein